MFCFVFYVRIGEISYDCVREASEVCKQSNYDPSPLLTFTGAQLFGSKIVFRKRSVFHCRLLYFHVSKTNTFVLELHHPLLDAIYQSRGRQNQRVQARGSDVLWLFLPDSLQKTFADLSSGTVPFPPRLSPWHRFKQGHIHRTPLQVHSGASRPSKQPKTSSKQELEMVHPKIFLDKSFERELQVHSTFLRFSELEFFAAEFIFSHLALAQEINSLFGTIFRREICCSLILVVLWRGDHPLHSPSTLIRVFFCSLGGLLA